MSILHEFISQKLFTTIVSWKIGVFEQEGKGEGGGMVNDYRDKATVSMIEMKCSEDFSFLA